MADEYGNISRSNRFNKKRKNTKALTILYILGIVLLVVLVAMLFLGGNDEETAGSNDQQAGDQEPEGSNPNDQGNQVILEKDLENDSAQNNDSSDDEELVVEVPDEENDQTSDEGEESSDSEETNDNGETNNNEETYQVESTDENVSRAYEGNWQPVGTEQEGTHITDYDDGSVDRKEMSRAVEVATDIPAGEQITWWAGRAGEDEVEVTISPKSDETKTYRVHLRWVDQKGWQPTLVEELIENKRD